MKGFFKAVGNFLGSIPVVRTVIKIGKNAWKGIKKLGKKLRKFIKKFRKKLGKIYTKARKKVRRLKRWIIRRGKRIYKAGTLWLKNTVQKGARWVQQKSKQVYEKTKQVYQQSKQKVEEQVNKTVDVLKQEMKVESEKWKKEFEIWKKEIELLKKDFKLLKDDTVLWLSNDGRSFKEKWEESKGNLKESNENLEKSNENLTGGTEQSKFPTKQIDPKKDQQIIDKVAEARGQLGRRYKEKGNFAYAEVNISGVSKKDFYAHSRIQDHEKNIPGAEEFSFKPDNPTFKATVAPDKAGESFLRDVDTEYKILNDLAERLGTNYEAKGTIKLFTEKVVCDSCDQVIQQFNEKYPNIKIEVIHNGDNPISPKSK
ncbi:deaminase domain-containing protein [Lysinibacillus sp. NPDC056232]|uniref:deaminase domain-containing protein n=1 Tax=Lysinibacillus sp. NPDC056232 TaxID=3345756 RepID=UPI0035D9C221